LRATSTTGSQFPICTVAKNTWQSEFNVTASRFAFKFVASNNWYYNWGIIRATQTNHFLPVAGTAAWRPGDGNDIIVSNAVPGLYRFTFNDSNFQFRVEMLYSAASGVNLLTNPSFEIEGSYTERAHGWEWGYPTRMAMSGTKGRPDAHCGKTGARTAAVGSPLFAGNGGAERKISAGGGVMARLSPA
jgi:hypothetical protein